MAAVVVLLLFLLRPGASRLKSRIIVSISAAVGRPVDIGSVHLRLLPWPGFDLENLVIYDDASYGAEPMLRAEDVTASLRLMSLLRGRLEIGRLDLTEPSLNVVSGEDGRWNLETLLEHAAHTPLAPTSKARLERRPGFPYIEATSGRINFMHGREKKAYALANADFSLWQDSENAWGVRLKAQPVRTDLNLNDTGTLLVTGTWQRADMLRDTPLDFTLAWDRPQLGQLTKLWTGVDQGWRGGVQLEVRVTGTASKLQIVSDAAIQDFRRYDITSGDPLRLAGHCEAQYSSLDHVFHDVSCDAPVGDGSITLTGEASFPGIHKYDLELSAENVPARALVALAQRAKKNLPDDLTTKGSLRGSLSIERAGGQSRRKFEGHGELADFQLVSAENKAEIGPQNIPFLLTDGHCSAQLAATCKAFHKKMQDLRFPSGSHIELGPFPISTGLATVGGWISRSGYDISFTGESDIGKTLLAARLVGIPALQASVEGSAQLNLEIAGPWAGWGNGIPGFSGPQVIGTAKLRSDRISLRSTAGPVEIATADLSLLPESVKVEKLNVRTANTSWTGSLDMPRGCGEPSACTIHFKLGANQIALSALHDWVHPRPKDRPWYRVLESSTAPASFFSRVRASGSVIADHAEIHNLAMTHVTADIALDMGKLKISGLTAGLLGGKCRGEWQTDFTVKPAISSGNGKVDGISLAALAEIMKDPWIAGSANGSFEFTATGSAAAELWQSADAALRFEVQNGVLPHISLEDEGPLQILRLAGQARLHGKQFEIKDAMLDSPSASFLLSGTASSKRELEMKLVQANVASGGYTITGTLAEPRVVPLSAEQARLKR